MYSNSRIKRVGIKYTNMDEKGKKILCFILFEHGAGLGGNVQTWLHQVFNLFELQLLQM